jgi:hypothetical protein
MKKVIFALTMMLVFFTIPVVNAQTEPISYGSEMDSLLKKVVPILKAGAKERGTTLLKIFKIPESSYTYYISIDLRKDLVKYIEILAEKSPNMLVINYSPKTRKVFIGEYKYKRSGYVFEKEIKTIPDQVFNDLKRIE